MLFKAVSGDYHVELGSMLFLKGFILPSFISITITSEHIRTMVISFLETFKMHSFEPANQASIGLGKYRGKYTYLGIMEYFNILVFQ